MLKPDWIKYILSKPEEFPRLGLFAYFFPLLGDGLLSSNGDLHRFQKRLLAPAFSSTNLKKYVSVFDKHTGALCQVSILLFYIFGFFFIFKANSYAVKCTINSRFLWQVVSWQKVHDINWSIVDEGESRRQ